MADRKHHRDQAVWDRLAETLRQQPWLDILIDLWQIARKLIVRHFPKGPYEVLEYESTPELLDPEGKHATFTKRERVRYLQDNIIAYQDQAWGDGEVRVARR